MHLHRTITSTENLAVVERKSSLLNYIKPAFFFLGLLCTITSMAQTATNVKLNGNAAATGDFIGTTNNENLVIKTNGQNHTIFQKDGDLKIVGLQGTINRLLFANANGVLKPLSQGEAGQVLMGDLTWGALPVSYWNINANGNKLSTTINKVGINTASPNFTLDVNGDGHFSGNLVLNGELIINEKITSPKQLTTAKVVADSIMMDASKAIYGETTIKGDVKLKYTLDVTGSSTFHGDQSIDGFQAITGGQSVNGNQNVNGSITARQGITFDGVKGINFVPNQNNGGVFRYGNNNLLQPIATACAAAPTTDISHQFGGIVQIFDPANPTTSGLLNLQTWTGGSSIDASVGANLGGGGLLLNYFCGNNTFINTNNGLPNRGGNVYMGEHVAMGRYVGIGYAGGIDNFSNTTALNIFANEDNQTAIKINTWNGTVKAINVVNTDGTENFTVMQNGKTTINTFEENAFVISGGVVSDVNFKVKNTGVVYAKEINVMNPPFPDYVFDASYKILPLPELEKYIKSNKHLPGFKSASNYDADGMPIGELVRLQQEKIEELTLYLIELRKEVEALKTKEVNKNK